MNKYTEWFDKINPEGLELRRLVEGGTRAPALTATYTLLDLHKFPAHVLGHTPDLMVDYGAADGRVGFSLAVAMDVGSLVAVNGEVDDLMSASSKVASVKALEYEMPSFDKKPDLIVMNDVVSFMDDRDKMLELFRRMVDQLTEKGIVLVVQTDQQVNKIYNVRENFEYIKQHEPNLLRRILFVLPNESSTDNTKEDVVMTAFEGDLASQLNNYRKIEHGDDLVLLEKRGI